MTQFDEPLRPRYAIRLRGIGGGFSRFRRKPNAGDAATPGKGGVVDGHAAPARTVEGAPEADAPLGLYAVPFHLARLVGRTLNGRQTMRAAPLGRDDVFDYLRRRVVGRAKALRRNLTLYLGDLAMAVAAVLLASRIRLGDEAVVDYPNSYHSLATAVPTFLLVCAVVFPFTCLYSRNWRYASVMDLLGIVRAACVVSLIFMFCMFVSTRLYAFPRSVIVMQTVLLVPLLVTLRMPFKLFEARRLGPAARGKRKGAVDVVPVLLVGAGDAADLYLRAIQRDRGAHHWPVGIIDGGLMSEGDTLRGIPVLGGFDDLAQVVRKLEARNRKPRHLIFTENVSGFGDPRMAALIDQADRLGIAVSKPAPVTELRNPKSENRLDLRPIELTDLLERPQTALDRGVLFRMVGDRRVLVTGAGGSIGSELAQQVAALQPSELVVLDNCEYNLYAIDLELGEKFPALSRKAYLCDVRDVSRLSEVFDRHRPELVFHAAALKHVPMVELNPCEGTLTNVIGTMNVAEAAQRCGATAMIQISTDKVVNTTNVMGATKRLAELFCQALDLASASGGETVRFMTVRFGNVLGSSGSLIPLFKRQLARGGPLTVTDPEMKRFFMTIREAVELTLQASAHGLEKRLGQGEIFVLDMGEPVKIIDMARRMIKLAGYRPDEDIRIDIVGCRPGEKLFEELFDGSEQRLSSPVPGVLRAVPNRVPLARLRRMFARLRRHAKNGEAEKVLELIAELLPSYRRQTPKAAPVPAAPVALPLAAAAGISAPLDTGRPAAA